MRAEALRPAGGGEIFSRATIDGFAFDAEVVFLAGRLHCLIAACRST